MVQICQLVYNFQSGDAGIFHLLGKITGNNLETFKNIFVKLRIQNLRTFDSKNLRTLEGKNGREKGKRNCSRFA